LLVSKVFSITLYPNRECTHRAQLINILTLGSPDGKGCFFPDGLHGEITVPTGFNTSVAATDDFPRVAPVAGQVREQPACFLRFILFKKLGSLTREKVRCGVRHLQRCRCQSSGRGRGAHDQLDF